MKKILIFSFLLPVFSACHQCKIPGNMRCRGNLVQVCTTDNRWKTTRDCNDFENTECKKIDGKDVCTCMKKEGDQ